MTEYAVRAPETSGTDEVEKTLNLMAGQGWRLVTASVEPLGDKPAPRVWLFFEREIPADIKEREITRGWLKASMRELDPKRSKLAT